MNQLARDGCHVTLLANRAFIMCVCTLFSRDGMMSKRDRWFGGFDLVAPANNYDCKSFVSVEEGKRKE